jgi:hypothetical protein
VGATWSWSLHKGHLAPFLAARSTVLAAGVGGLGAAEIAMPPRGDHPGIHQPLPLARGVFCVCEHSAALVGCAPRLQDGS